MLPVMQNIVIRAFKTQFHFVTVNICIWDFLSVVLTPFSNVWEKKNSNGPIMIAALKEKNSDIQSLHDKFD